MNLSAHSFYPCALAVLLMLGAGCAEDLSPNSSDDSSQATLSSRRMPK